MNKLLCLIGAALVLGLAVTPIDAAKHQKRAAISKAQATSASVALAWYANSEPDIAGYKVRYGTASHSYTEVFDVGNVTETVVSNLQLGTLYYFALTAYNQDAMESGLSDEVSAPILSTPTPTPSPTPNFTISISPNPVIIPTRGWTVPVTITVTRTNFQAGISLSVTGLPVGLRPSFSPLSPTTADSVLTLTIDDCLPRGTYPSFTVTGRSSGLTRTASARFVKQ